MKTKVLFTAMLCCIGLSASAQTVCSMGSKEYASIQEAVNAVTKGDIIKVLADVKLKSTIMVSSSTPAFTIDLNGHVLDGSLIPMPTKEGELGNIIENFGDLVLIDTNPEATHTDSLQSIRGGVLTGGKGGYNAYEEGKYWANRTGGAIFNMGQLSMNGITIYRNFSVVGAGITNDMGGNITLDNCALLSNEASEFTAGLLLYDGYVKLTDCTISNNKAQDIGGAFCEEGCTLDMTRCTISENIASEEIGAIMCQRCVLNMTDCTVSSNSSKNIGGVHNYNGVLTMTSCRVTDNACMNDGSGLYLENGKTILDRCTFSGNTGKNGAAIYAYNDSLVMTGCEVIGNQSSLCGGGVDSKYSILRLSDCKFVDNAGKYGGGAYHYKSVITAKGCSYNGNTAIYGAGMYCSSDSVVVTGCDFMENKADDTGGGILSVYGSLKLQQSNVNGNKGLYAAGIFLNTVSSDLSDCNFCENKCDKAGGGLYVDSCGLTNITRCIFRGNVAGYQGGGVNIVKTDIKLTDCGISENSGWLGGGLVLESGKLYLKGCQITDNKASECGAGLETSGQVTVEDCVITGNSSASDYPSGGFYHWRDDSTYLVLKGKMIIKDNTSNGKPANLCLVGYDIPEYVTLEDITEGTEMGVSTAVNDVEGAYRFTTQSLASDLQYFTSDNDSYVVRYNPSGYHELVAHATSVDAVAGTSDAEAVMYDLNGRKLTSADVQKGIYITNGRKVLR